VLVKEVSARRLPEVTDAWVADVSEFETVEELRKDIATRIAAVRKVETSLTARERLIDALADRVGEEIPSAMVGHEMELLLERFLARRRRQDVELADFLKATGESEEALMDRLRTQAERAVRAELALRAIGESEDLHASEEEIVDELARVAERTGKKATEVRKALEKRDAWGALRSDIVDRAALEFALRCVEIKSEAGAVLDVDELLRPTAADPSKPSQVAEAHEEDLTE
jgi:trigger factor